MSEESNIVVSPAEFVPDYRLIARDPSELEASRSKLKLFFDARINALQRERADLDANLTIAAKFPIRTQPITAQITRVQKRIDYYTKARAAVEAGFHIIPNFEADVFAIRTTRKDYTTEQTSNWRLPEVAVPPVKLGEGRYVSNVTPTFREATYEEASRVAGQPPQKRTVRWGEGLDEEIEFPFVLARPEVLEATRAVMAEKIFDELAVLPHTKKARNADPMVVGIIRESGSRQSWRNVKRMSFLVVWFLDTNTL